MKWGDSVFFQIGSNHSWVAFEIGVIPSVFCPFVCQHFCFWTRTQKCFVQSNSNLTGR